MKTLPNIVPGPMGSGFRLRLATRDDREALRIWKNEHKQSYFHRADISPEQQAAWFEGYLARPDDHVYMIDEELGSSWKSVGVVAARFLSDENTVDLYNIMRGFRTSADRTNMGAALRTLCCAVARAYSQPITCKVLSDNPALGWYARLGFIQVEDRGDHKLLRYQGDVTR
jgi:hypothetical protein